jgi:hypothetical protein
MHISTNTFRKAEWNVGEWHLRYTMDISAYDLEDRMVFWWSHVTIELGQISSQKSPLKLWHFSSILCLPRAILWNLQWFGTKVRAYLLVCSSMFTNICLLCLTFSKWFSDDWLWIFDMFWVFLSLWSTSKVLTRWGFVWIEPSHNLFWRFVSS